ncbi:MAG: penicillin-binding protein 2 [bacterium]|nr:penicillin-binding protein 2 [bacterium]
MKINNTGKIRARQILTNIHSSSQTSGEDFFVLPTGELHPMADAVPINRLKFLGFAGILLLGILVLRGTYLQASQGIFRKQVQNNWLRLRVEYAPRGVIFDHKGQQLVQNVASTDLVIYPIQLPKDIESEITILREIFTNVPAEAFQEIMNGANRTSTLPVPLLSNITHEQMVAVLAREDELPGLSVENLPTREYKDGNIFAHIMGYMGRISEEEHKKNPDYLLTESLGKNGVESAYESVLRGEHGARREEVNSSGRIINDLGTVPAKPGLNLKLNIDADLQKRLYQDLEIELKNAGASRATAVALDPRTGGVLAMVSIPSFDNTKLTQGISGKDATDLFSNKDTPMLNRAIQGEYPPGSTFKLAVAIAGLEEKIITSETTINSTGGIRVGSWFFPDWKPGGHGITNLNKAIAESVNTYFYTLGGGLDNVKGLGIEKMESWAKKMGFGGQVGIDIPGEVDGFLPTADWKLKVKKEPWYIGDTYHAAIGQGDILVTPLQIAQITAVIANGGIFYEPRIVNSLVKNDGGVVEEIKPVKRPGSSIDASIANIMRQAMRETVLTGSGRALGDLSVAVAGKTGTAQSASGLENTHAWFTSFAPYDNPQIALTILLEKAGGGDKIAVPIAKDIYGWYFGDRTKESTLLKSNDVSTVKPPLSVVPTLLPSIKPVPAVLPKNN